MTRRVPGKRVIKKEAPPELKKPVLEAKVVVVEEPEPKPKQPKAKPHKKAKADKGWSY